MPLAFLTICCRRCNTQLLKNTSWLILSFLNGFATHMDKFFSVLIRFCLVAAFHFIFFLGHFYEQHNYIIILQLRPTTFFLQSITTRCFSRVAETILFQLAAGLTQAWEACFYVFFEARDYDTARAHIIWRFFGSFL